MKLLIYFFKYNWKMLLSAIFFFVIVWQSYTLVLLFQSELTYTDETIQSESENIEQALNNSDFVKLKLSLWKIKRNKIKALEFIPPKEIREHLPSLVIGDVTTSSYFFSKRYFNLSSGGAFLGNINIEIDNFYLLKMSFYENAPLYLFVSFFFVFILFFINIGTLKNLLFLEKSLIEINNDLKLETLGEIQKKLINNIKINNNSTAAIAFSDFIERYLFVLRSKAAIDIELTKSQTKYEVTRQFAHDVKSPTHTLGVLSSRMKDKLDTNEYKLFKMALKRIVEASNYVLFQDRSFKNEKKLEEKRNIIPVFDEIIKAKQTEFEHEENVFLKYKNLSTEVIMANIPSESLFNILSNIINNAYDAVDNRGEIVVTTQLCGDILKIEVYNTGEVIPENIIDKIWLQGFSYNKRTGNGLGLGQTRKIVEESWGGGCYCTSSLDAGTIIGLDIPLVVQ